MRGTASNNGHTSQVVAVIVSDAGRITPQAPRGQMVLQMGDRWSNQAGYGYGFDVFNPLTMVNAAELEPPTARDIPRVPVPSQFPATAPTSWFPVTQNLAQSPFQNPAIWETMDTFFPFLPEGYEEAMGSAEWVRPEWPVPVFNNVSQFFYDIENADWSIGPNNNFLDNAQFENDRVAGGRDILIDGLVHTKPIIQSYVNRPIGWHIEEPEGQPPAQVNWGGGGNGRASGVNVFRYQLGNPETYNSSTGLPTQSWYSAWAGNHTWYHGFSKRNPGTEPYQARTYQVPQNLPDGVYTFYGWFRSSGGQEEAYLYAGADRAKKVDLSSAIGTWTLYAIENIVVTNGQLEVGIYSNAAADQWLYIDDVALIRTGDLPDSVFLQQRAASVLRNGLNNFQLILTANNRANLILVLDGREYIIATNVNNRNVSGRFILPDGSGTLVFDIKGNGSNIKEFRIISNW